MENVTLENGHAIVAGFITVYNYLADTGEFIGKSQEFIPVGVGLPALSTEIKPPEKTDGKAVVWRGSWVQMDDHRGKTVYSTSNGTSSVVEYLGPVVDGYTLLKPATAFDKWDGSKWVQDEAARQKAELAENSMKKTSLIAEASAVIAPLKDAFDGGYIDETDKPKLTAWQKYRYELTKVDPANPVWPAKPE